MLPHAVKSAQRAAERLMIDSCTIQRPGEGGVDPLTGEPVITLDPVYTGKCRVQLSKASSTTAEVIGRTATIQDFEIHIPATAPLADVNDVVTLTASPAVHRRIGQQFRVTAVFEKTLTSAQRLAVERTH